jgi:ABC-2 type transport system permease protein
VTFTLEPRRSRVVVAKLVAGVIAAVTAVAVALSLAIVGNLLYGAITGDTIVWDVTTAIIIGVVVAWIIGLATGFAFGMLIMNTAAAIVLFFIYKYVLPGLLAWGAATVGWIHDIRPWIDFNNAQGPLFDGSMSGSDWSHLLVSGVLWFAVPLMVGIWRLLRAEVK